MSQASHKSWVCAGLFFAMVAGSAVDLHAQSGPNPFRRVEWGNLPPGREWGGANAIDVDRDGQHIWTFDRCGSPQSENTCLGRDDIDPIIKWDLQGNIVKSFGAGRFVFPHGLHIDHEGNVWVVDGAGVSEEEAARFPEARGRGHQVHKFSPDGELLMSLGTAGVAGNSPHHFDQPTAVYVAPNGDIFVVDGHAYGPTDNNRVVKFSPDGRYLLEFGGPGSARGQLSGPHAIAMDSQGRVFIADRGNNRIQIFDQDGNLLQVWTQFGKPSGIFIDPNDVIYVADSTSALEHRYPNPGYERGIRIGDARTGWVTAFILWDDGTESGDPRRPGPGPEGSGPEGIAADAEGNVYLGITRDPEVQKYVRVRP